MHEQETSHFDFAQAEPIIQAALEAAAYEVDKDQTEPNLIRARKDAGVGSQQLFIDAGGQLRFTLTRPTGPEQLQKFQTSTEQVWEVTRESCETLTVSLQLDAKQATNFALLLTELAKI